MTAKGWMDEWVAFGALSKRDCYNEAADFSHTPSIVACLCCGAPIPWKNEVQKKPLHYVYHGRGDWLRIYLVKQVNPLFIRCLLYFLDHDGSTSITPRQIFRRSGRLWIIAIGRVSGIHRTIIAAFGYELETRRYGELRLPKSVLRRYKMIIMQQL
jgi:hypothetical protein